MIKTEQQTKVLELRAKGLSIIEITKEVHLSRNTVTDVIKQNKELVSTLYGIELDGLYKSLKITKEHRLTSLSNTLKKIEEELNKRDFSDVPTEKLIELYLKNHALLDSEAVEPVLLSTEEITSFKKERALLTDINPVKEIELKDVVEELSVINSEGGLAI